MTLGLSYANEDMTANYQHETEVIRTLSTSGAPT